MRAAARVAIAFLVALGSRDARADAPTATLVDPNFERWTDGNPTAWRVEWGLTSDVGVEPKHDSKVERGAEGGVSLSGTNATKRWKYVAQAVAVEPGTSYRLRFEARGTPALEGEVLRGAYVGLADRDSGALRLRTLRSETTFRPRWTPCEVIFRAGTREADVILFLPWPGRLDVRGLRWETLTSKDTFDALVDDMSRYYSYLGRRVPDWGKHAALFRERATAARDESALVDVLFELLAPLDDAHISITTSDGRLRVPAPRAVDAGIDGKAIYARLESPRPIERVGFRGTAAEGIEYIVVGSLPGSGRDTMAARAGLLEAFEQMLGAKALIIDLRANGGGDERTAQEVGAMLADESRAYAQRRFRSGPAPDDFGPWTKAFVSPRKEKRFSGPIVAILGPGCMSSGEGMAQMLSVLPNVTTIGKPTRGASGSPAPCDLPNGLTVAFSRWQNAMLDGTLLEGRGVIPSEAVELGGKDDPAFRRAIEIAKAKLSAKPR